jgi:hypothetical protein
MKIVSFLVQRILRRRRRSRSVNRCFGSDVDYQTIFGHKLSELLTTVRLKCHVL